MGERQTWAHPQPHASIIHTGSDSETDRQRTHGARTESADGVSGSDFKRWSLGPGSDALLAHTRHSLESLVDVGGLVSLARPIVLAFFLAISCRTVACGWDVGQSSVSRQN